MTSSDTSIASENQSKFIQNRISQVEKHFGNLCSSFGNYNRKLKGIRDCGDDISKNLLEYSKSESFNHTTKGAVKQFAENFSGVQDFREVESNYIHSKVIQPLMSYGYQCKQAKARLKQAFSARDKEMKQKKRLDKVKTNNPADRSTITQAESDLQRASVDATHSSKVLEEEVDNFEVKKLRDMKRILNDFVSTELKFHAKALEMYTHCYEALQNIKEDEDLEEFRNSLRPHSLQTRIAQVQSSQSTASRPAGSLQMNGTGNQTSRSTTETITSSMYTEDDDEEDDDDDDDEEDDDEEEETETDTSEVTPRRK